jgi:hypothetical protein
MIANVTPDLMMQPRHTAKLADGSQTRSLTSMFPILWTQAYVQKLASCWLRLRWFHILPGILAWILPTLPGNSPLLLS